MAELETVCDKQGIRKTTYRLVAVYFSLLVLSSLTFKPGGKFSDLASSITYIIPIIAALFACLWASKHSASYKRMWRLISLSVFFWLSGAIVLTYYMLTYGVSNVPFPSLADAFTVAYIPIILGVMLSLGKIRPPFDSEKKQFLTNMAMASLIAFLLCYEFIILPTWHSSSDSIKRMTMIAYPIFDWTIFISLLFASYRFRQNQIEGWLILLISAFSSAILSDIAIYITGSIANPFSMLTMIAMAILVAVSAIDEVTGAFIGIIERPDRGVRNNSKLNYVIRSSWRTLLTPLMTTLIVPAVWLASSYSMSNKGLPVLIAVSTLIIMLSVYRNHLLATDNAILFEKTLRDSLTGLNNHRFFQEAFTRTLTASDRIDKPVSLIILDIDDFSRLNKTFGHNFGDRILSSIGDTIASKIREIDEACRLDSDKFGIILPQTSESEALIQAEKLKNDISETLAKNFPGRTITTTLGVSTYPSIAKDKEDLFQTADGALYWGKLNGKDKVLLYNPKVVTSISAEERAAKAEEVAQIDMVRSLAKAVDTRDQYTRLHSKRVSELACRLARCIGLDDTAITRIEVAGVLHDVGKIGIPDNILNKPGRLTEDEMTIIRNHPVFSAQIISSTSLKEIIPAVESHHERWDGKGYPDSLKGDDIPFDARILAIADTFDAMTSDRPYRKGLSIEEALSEIKRCSGTQFDPYLADQFISIFSPQLLKARSKGVAQKQAELLLDIKNKT